MYEIGGDHERHFTDDGIIKLADIQPGQLLDLVQAVDQGIAVEIEISGALCNAKTRVQKGMDGVQGLIINIRQVEPVEMIVQIFFTGLDRQLTSLPSPRSCAQWMCSVSEKILPISIAEEILRKIPGNWSKDVAIRS